TIRRTSADIMGFAYYHAPMDLQAQAYAQLCRLAATGEIALDIETRPLSEIGAAWDADAAGSRKRQGLVPESTALRGDAQRRRSNPGSSHVPGLLRRFAPRNDGGHGRCAGLQCFPVKVKHIPRA